MSYANRAERYGLIEAPLQRLKAMQQQIVEDVLAHVLLHDAVHGFRTERSIVTFAAPHCARAAVLRMDLKNFFPSLTGPRVQALFRTLGYPEPVADLLGGLCTTTTPARTWRQTGCVTTAAELLETRLLYARSHVPQGAPTSPALANLLRVSARSPIERFGKGSGRRLHPVCRRSCVLG